MARGAKPRARELPPPLPPERRTVGQLIAESIRLYGAHCWRALPLGLVLAGVNQFTLGLGREETSAVLVAAAPVFTLAYAYATQLTTGRKAPVRAWLGALRVGALVFVPAALLFPWFAPAGVLLLALVGFLVSAAVLQGHLV